MSIVDVHRGQLLDIVPSRDPVGPTVWLLAQPEAWRDNIDWGVLDLSGAYRRAFEAAPPQPARSPTRSTSSAWPTTASTRCAAAPRTTRSGSRARRRSPYRGRAAC